MSTVFRPTRVETVELLRSFVSPWSARGLAIPWVDVGLVLPSVPMFMDPDLCSGFTKHLGLVGCRLVARGEEYRFWQFGGNLVFPPSSQGISSVL
jgi:hypothetical protein